MIRDKSHICNLELHYRSTRAIHWEKTRKSIILIPSGKISRHILTTFFMFLVLWNNIRILQSCEKDSKANLSIAQCSVTRSVISPIIFDAIEPNMVVLDVRSKLQFHRSVYFWNILESLYQRHYSLSAETVNYRRLIVVTMI